MTTIDTQEDLFPTWFKKLQVTFSGRLPIHDNEHGQVFVVPYSVFQTRIAKRETHTLKAIEHMFAIPYSDLEAAVRDYKPKESE